MSITIKGKKPLILKPDYTDKANFVCEELFIYDLAVCRINPFSIQSRRKYRRHSNTANSGCVFSGADKALRSGHKAANSEVEIPDPRFENSIRATKFKAYPILSL
ncbi:MAG: hypothetical protein OEX02_01120 [Cyclobacteriaceae bacterium]|nr:hypothetical protein [Cyclobacteriaceae bacterium]